MAQKLTDAIIKALPTPATGNRIHYDSEVKGFGCRVTANGARAFVLNYRTRIGRERRYTIGSVPEWSVKTAREEAQRLKRLVDGGGDPMADLEADRGAKTVADLCDRYIADHLPKKRPASAADDKAMIQAYILPKMKHLKVSGEVSHSDIDDLHRAVTNKGKPYRANRVVALLSKMFALAIRLGWRVDNPCKGIERNQEKKRHRYLSPEELKNLTKALAEHDDKQAADIIRLLLLTGARRGEVLSATWDQFDLQAGIWIKPGSTTKQKTDHRVPLSAPAQQILREIKAEAERIAESQKKPLPDYVFPGRFGKGHRADIKKNWRALCRAAGIVKIETKKDKNGKERTVVEPSARIHDLRHTYASVLVSAGLSLPIIGALLGHTQAATTHRYAHLMDDPLRQATERAGAIVTARDEGAEVVPLKGRA